MTSEKEKTLVADAAKLRPIPIVVAPAHLLGSAHGRLLCGAGDNRNRPRKYANGTDTTLMVQYEKLKEKLCIHCTRRRTN